MNVCSRVDPFGRAGCNGWMGDVGMKWEKAREGGARGKGGRGSSSSARSGFLLFSFSFYIFSSFFTPLKKKVSSSLSLQQIPLYHCHKKYKDEKRGELDREMDGGRQGGRGSQSVHWRPVANAEFMPLEESGVGRIEVYRTAERKGVQSVCVWIFQERKTTISV